MNNTTPSFSIALPGLSNVKNLAKTFAFIALSGAASLLMTSCQTAATGDTSNTPNKMASNPATTPTPEPQENVMHVALMFDDGPGLNTLRLLDVLNDYNVKATFDLIGQNCDKSPKLVKAIQEEGHTIMNHSYTHAVPGDLSDNELRAEITKCNASLDTITGDHEHWYWPPYIAIDPRLSGFLAEQDMELANCDTLVGAQDYENSVSAEQIRDLSISLAKDGSLILFHDWRDASVDMMPAIIEGLRAKGAVFLTYPEMDAYLKSKAKEQQ